MKINVTSLLWLIFAVVMVIIAAPYVTQVMGVLGAQPRGSPPVYQAPAEVYSTVPVEELPFGATSRNAQPLVAAQGEAPTLMSVFGNDPTRAQDYWKKFRPTYPLATVNAAAAEAVGVDDEGDVIEVFGYTFEPTRRQVVATVHAFVATGFTREAVLDKLQVRVVDEHTVVVSIEIAPCVTMAGIPIASNPQGTPEPGVRIENVKKPSPWWWVNWIVPMDVIYYHVYEDEAYRAQVAINTATVRAIRMIFEGDRLYRMFATSVANPGAVWVNPQTGESEEGAYAIARAIAREAVCAKLAESGISCDAVNIQFEIRAGPQPSEWRWCGTGETFFVP